MVLTPKPRVGPRWRAYAQHHTVLEPLLVLLEDSVECGASLLAELLRPTIPSTAMWLALRGSTPFSPYSGRPSQLEGGSRPARTTLPRRVSTTPRTPVLFVFAWPAPRYPRTQCIHICARRNQGFTQQHVLPNKQPKTQYAPRPHWRAFLL
eukprot:5794607-Prymnesium_polylepis.1